ncbi:hypothetical protein bas09_0063 [Changchunvirus paulsarasin]|uniref:Uncharacterized protein n=1 Tax=Escherichia phage PaulSarasin TaxID=2851973 RepID=A0AAE7VXZ7_9CAUD|nr:hypothetical protein bas09_0063 [Escherichia phage PaulSarasin]
MQRYAAIISDFAMVLQSGCFIHNPSIALFVKSDLI